MKQLQLLVLLFLTFLCKGQQDIDYTALNLDSIFQESSGTFVLCNYNKNSYEIYNYERANAEYAVHSTSKIFWSIIGLEENIITENSVIKWDSVKYPKKDWWPEGWAQDLNIVSALSQSVNWYYFQLLSQMTPEMVEKHLKSLDYKKDYKVEKVHYFGFAFTVRKSAMEQIDFLKRLYRNDLKISEKTLDLVKKGLTYEKTEDYVLYAKTGLGPVDNDNGIGWFIGFIEKGSDLYFFALNVENEDESIAAKLRTNYSMRVLKALGLI